MKSESLEWFSLVKGIKQCRDTEEKTGDSPGGCMELLGLYESSNTNMVHDTSDGVFTKLVEVIPEVIEEKAILTRFYAHEIQDIKTEQRWRRRRRQQRRRRSRL